MQALTKNSLIIAWLQSLDLFDYKKIKFLRDYFLDVEGYKECLEREKPFFVKEIGLEKYEKLLKSANKEYLNGIINRLKDKKIYIIDKDSQFYPSNFLDLENPPLALYCKGDCNLLKGNLLTVVGSRKSLAFSVNVAKEMVKDLSSQFTVVTGLAQGVEKGILEEIIALNKSAICILPCGIEKVYPSAHQNVVDGLCKTGLVISEYFIDEGCRTYYFPRRNELLGSISKGTLIINGEIKSGVMQTADSAIKNGNPIFAIPYSIGVKSGEGCNYLIKNGARLTDSVNDIFDYFNLENKKESALDCLTELELAIVKTLVEPMHVEKLAIEVNKQAFELAPTLAMLEIKGVIIKSGTNVYRLAK